MPRRKTAAFERNGATSRPVSLNKPKIVDSDSDDDVVFLYTIPPRQSVLAAKVKIEESVRPATFPSTQSLDRNRAALPPVVADATRTTREAKTKIADEGPAMAMNGQVTDDNDDNDSVVTSTSFVELLGSEPEMLSSSHQEDLQTAPAGSHKPDRAASHQQTVRRKHLHLLYDDAGIGRQGARAGNAEDEGSVDDDHLSSTQVAALDRLLMAAGDGHESVDDEAATSALFANFVPPSMSMERRVDGK